MQYFSKYIINSVIDWLQQALTCFKIFLFLSLKIIKLRMDWLSMSSNMYKILVQEFFINFEICIFIERQENKYFE